MPVLPRDPDIHMCARTARGAEHELLHGPPGVSSSNVSKPDLVSSTVAANWCKMAKARSSRMCVFVDDLVSFRALDWSNEGEVYGQEAS
jgi:hypothetical protein